MRRTYRGIAAAAAAIVLLAGCGSKSSDSGSSGDAGEQASRLPAYDINPQPRDNVKDGGTFKLAVTEFRTQWNYWHLNGLNLEAFKTLRTMMPLLFLSDQKAVVKADPDYLTDAKVTKTSPKQVVTYDLNPKAKWSDGTPFGYKDFVALWQATNGKNKAYQIGSTTGYDQIESVARGSSDQQVVVTFAKPFGEWQSLFSPLYPAKAIDSPAKWNKSWVNKIPITAGPFKLEKIDQTAKTISVVRDPKWWGNKAKLDRVVFRAMGDDAMAGAFVNGEVDSFDVGGNASAYKRAKEASNVSIRKAAGPDFRHLTFNGTSPILKDVNVRKAIAMAINREAIVQSDLKDLDWPVQLLNNHAYMNTQQGYQDNSGDVGKYNLDAAKKLLDQAGWTVNGQNRQKAGKTLTIRFIYPTTSVVAKQEGELTQAMLQQAGVKVDLQAVADDDFFDKYVIPGNYDITPFAWIGTPYPISGMPSIYGSVKNGNVQQNFARTGSTALDAKMAQANSELDPAKARTDANEADQMIWNEVHSLTLYQRPQIVPTKNTIANWGALGFYDPNWSDIGFTK